MKKIIFYLTVLTILLYSIKTFSQVNTYYWFTVIVKTYIDQDGILKYKVLSSSRAIYSGDKETFEKAIWEGLRRRRIVVGGFPTKEDAINARYLYKPKKEKIKTKPVINGTIYWFAIHFEEQSRLHIYVIRRKPGAVQAGSGTLDKFITSFYEQLNFGMFTIGPFKDKETAEMMKNLYRRNE